MKNPLRALGGHRPDGDVISAWLDGALNAPAAARLEAHMQSCDACRARADALRAVRASVAALPNVDAPRSFRLHPAQLEAPRRAPAPSLWSRYAPAASAVALVVFAVLVSVDVAGRGDGGPSGAGFGLSSESGGDMAANSPAERALDSADSPPAGAIAPDSDSPAAATAADGAESQFDSATPPTAMPQDQRGALTREDADETPDGALTSQFEEAEDDDGGTDWLRVAEIAAIVVALVAALYAATTFRRRATT